MHQVSAKETPMKDQSSLAIGVIKGSVAGL